MSSIVPDLGCLDWDERRSAHAEAELRFAQLGAEDAIARLRGALREEVDVGRSVEKTTHYKWFLGRGEGGCFELWLHEYKPARLRRAGHATVPHNHRFWLTSLILRGGFVDTRYARTAGGGDGQIEPVATRDLDPGETMVIDPEEIHSLSELREGTLSLVVQSRPVRSYSEVFEGGEVRRYSDLEAQLAGLRASLRPR